MSDSSPETDCVSLVHRHAGDLNAGGNLEGCPGLQAEAEGEPSRGENRVVVLAPALAPH